MLTKTNAQEIAKTQNASTALFQRVDAAIKTAAGLGDYSVVVTLTVPEQALDANLEADLELRGFSVAVTGDDDEIYTITFSAP